MEHYVRTNERFHRKEMSHGIKRRTAECFGTHEIRAECLPARRCWNWEDGRHQPFHRQRSGPHRQPGTHWTCGKQSETWRNDDTPLPWKNTNYCIFIRKCNKYKVCNFPPSSGLGKCSRCRIVSYNKYCPDFVEDKCRKLDRSLYVCNGCKELKSCSKRKYFYSALNAMKEYRTVLVEFRQGIDASETEIQQGMELIRHGLSRGQALHHMMTSHSDIFQKCEKPLTTICTGIFLTCHAGACPG